MKSGDSLMHYAIKSSDLELTAYFLESGGILTLPNDNFNRNPFVYLTKIQYFIHLLKQILDYLIELKN